MAEAAVGGLESAVPEGAAGDGRFPCFDGYRAIAATSVLLTHVSFITLHAAHSIFGPYLARLDVGVAVFFLVSGFLLYRPFALANLAGRRSPATLPYFRRRALRIFPAYWVALTVGVFAFHMGARPEAKGLALFYTLTHIYSPRHVIAPLTQSWTLATEISFYLFLPLYHRVMRAGDGSAAARLRRELFGVVGLYVLGLALRMFVLALGLGDTWTGLLLTWLPAYFDQFALGMALAVASVWLAREGRRAPFLLDRRAAPALCWTLAAVSFWIVCTRFGLPTYEIKFTSLQDMARQFFYGTTAFFFLLPGVFGPQDRGLIRAVLRSRIARSVGLISYGVYLWHDIWIDRFFRWTSFTPFAGNFALVLTFVVVCTLASATISYVVVERPALRLKYRTPILATRAAGAVAREPR